MAKPRVIMHNSVSLDGSATNFEVNMGLHYQLAGEYKQDIHFVGSNTIKTGMEQYLEEIPPEDESDFKKPEKNTDQAYWVIPDTRGILRGLLHTCRRDQFCPDVIILVSDTTPEDYIQYLEERHYDYIVCGDDHVDYEKAFEILNKNYGAKTVLVDAGPVLNGILLEKGLIDEISLLVMPELVGKKSLYMFSGLNLEERNIELELLESRVIENSYVLLRYRVLNKETG